VLPPDTCSLLLTLPQYLSITIDSGLGLIAKFMACEDNICNPPTPTYDETGLDSQPTARCQCTIHRQVLICKDNVLTANSGDTGLGC